MDDDEVGREDHHTADDDNKRLLKSARSRTVRFQDEVDEGDQEGKEGEKKENEELQLVAGVKTKKKKPKFMLPWGCQFIGWAVAFCTVGVAFWLTIEVAGQFGVEKATEWLTSMACSLVQDILFSQPIKVCAMRIICNQH